MANELEDGASHINHSIAISLKRIADAMEIAIGILADDDDDLNEDAYTQMANQS